MKENIASGLVEEFDSEDNSWTRPKKDLLCLLKEAELAISIDKKQLNFPKGIYEVRMMALRKSQNKEYSSQSEDD